MYARYFLLQSFIERPKCNYIVILFGRLQLYKVKHGKVAYIFLSGKAMLTSLGDALLNL